MTTSWFPEIEGVITAEQVRQTVDGIADWQLDSGMVPWFPDGHADVWNHTEALMALQLGGRRTEAERGFDWLRSIQRPDGSWHQYYLADSIEQDKLDANCVAYVAAGLYHHWLLFEDRGFLEETWPMLDKAIDFVLGLQTDRGEIIWARHADGTPWAFALLTGSSSMAHSLRCALAVADVLGHERPSWEVGAAKLRDVILHSPEAFAPKHRWAMDWYYPVLTGVVTGEAGRHRLDARRDAFVMDGKGVRCVSDRPWITAAETCECAMAHLSVGLDEMALDMFRWSQRLRHEDGHYWTGIVFPDEVHFPGGEQSTYTSAAVVLTADALVDLSPAAWIFSDHDRLRSPRPDSV